LRPPPALGGSAPSFGLKLFIEAQAWISVPSTEKWSVLSRRFTRGCAKTALSNFAATSPSSNRSRFLENVEWSQTPVVNADAHEPAKQQIEFQPFHQLPFRTDK
jgi:hypothetical protein